MPAFVLGEELADLADRDERIVVATADLANSSRTRDFAARHPSRFIDFGIAERKTIGFVRTWPGGTLNRHILLTTSRLSPRRRATSRRLNPSMKTSCRTRASTSTPYIPGLAPYPQGAKTCPVAGFYTALRRHNGGAPLAEFLTAVYMLQEPIDLRMVGAGAQRLARCGPQVLAAP